MGKMETIDQPQHGLLHTPEAEAHPQPLQEQGRFQPLSMQPPPSIRVKDHSIVLAMEEVPFEGASPMDAEEVQDGFKYISRP
jgi:hypothetical protein